MQAYSKDLKSKLGEQVLRIITGELTRDAVKKGLPKLKEQFSKAKKKTQKYDEDEEAEAED